MTNGDNKQVNPLIAGLTGAAIGAGVAALTTKVLTDKKMRDKMMKTAADIKEKVASSMYKAGEELKRGKEMAEKEISSTAHRIRIGGRGRSKTKGGRKSLTRR